MPVRTSRLRVWACLAAALPVSAAAQAARIDTHIHIYDPSRPQGVPWPSPGETLLYRTVLPDHHAAVARPQGVTGAIVVEASDWLEDNQWVLDRIRDRPDYLGLVGNLELGSPGFQAALDRFSRDRKFLGIRLSTQTVSRASLAGALLFDLQALAAKGLVLEMLVYGISGSGNSLDAASAIAEKVPNLRIMLDHLAGMPVDGRPPSKAWSDAVMAAARHPRMHAKVSGLFNQAVTSPAPVRPDYYAPVLDLLWNAFGPDRLVYGSNWPVSELGGAFGPQQDVVLAYFEAKGGAAGTKVMAENARAFYSLPVTSVVRSFAPQPILPPVTSDLLGRRSSSRSVPAAPGLPRYVNPYVKFFW